MYRRLWGLVLVLAGIVGLLVWAHGKGGPEVRYAALSGQGLKGTAAILAWPGRGVEVFVYLEGLKPGSGSYANHIHYNEAGNANCKAQNGDKLLGLSPLVPDANGRAVAYTRLSVSVAYPKGSTYVNVHANAPTPVGGSIACGDVEVVGESYGEATSEQGGVAACPEVIEIRDFAFHPNRCFVRAGGQIRFVNQDAAPHTATSRDAPAPFDTGTLKQGQTSSPILLTTKGSYTYFCRIHPSMEGRIEVR